MEKPVWASAQPSLLLPLLPLPLPTAVSNNSSQIGPPTGNVPNAQLSHSHIHPFSPVTDSIGLQPERLNAQLATKAVSVDPGSVMEF